MDPITPLSVYQAHYGPGTPGAGRAHKYVPLKLGWIVSSEMRRPGHINDKPGPSYARIDLINEITDEGIKHTIEIRDFSVYLNGSLIASSPAGKTKAFRLKFCKAVIWGLMDNRDDLRDLLDKISDKQEEEAPAPYKAPAPVIMGPFSLYGWIKYGSCLIKEEALSCN